MGHLKKIIILSFFLPQIVLGATAVGWNTPTVGDGYILPNLVNGVNQIVKMVNGFLSTASSTIVGNATTTGNFSAGNTLFVKSVEGQVGIGTMAPSSKLHVSGGDLTLDNTHSLKLSNTAGTSFGTVYLDSANRMYVSNGSPFGDMNINVNGGTITLGTLSGPSFNLLNSGVASLTPGSNGGLFGVSSTSPWGLLSVDPNNIGSGVPEFVVGSSTATHLIVNGNGFTGVGTTSPFAKFSISNYSPGVNTAPLFVIASSTGALATTTNLVVDSVGKVGLGTKTPTAQFTVYDGASTNKYLTEYYSNGNLRSRLWGTFQTSGDETSGSQEWYLSSGEVGQGKIVYKTPGGAPGITFFTGATYDQNRFDIRNRAGEYFQIAFSADSPVNGLSKGLYLKAGGNIGIGNTAPSYILDVSPVDKITTNLLRVATTTGDGLYVLNSGKTGIGTSTPLWTLNPYSATQSQLALSAGAGVAQWAFRNAGGNFYLATTTAQGTATTSISAITALANGGVGIGTTTPSSTASLSVGVNPGGTASSTIRMETLQWEGKNSAGVVSCLFIVGTTPTVVNTPCNN